VQNVQAGPLLKDFAQKEIIEGRLMAEVAVNMQGEKPKTDFAELHAPFTITNGLVNTLETTLRSPFIRVSAAGGADLVSESLDMKVKPTLVGTIKGQGNGEERQGVPISNLWPGSGCRAVRNSVKSSRRARFGPRRKKNSRKM
jgi:hypothetical protein